VTTGRRLSSLVVPMDDWPLRARLALATRVAAAAKVVADRLAGLGFTNVAAAASGVSVEGARGDFERGFGAAVVVDQSGARFEREPVLTELFGTGVESMSFPTKPRFFDR
jgi:hypothetical protein